MTTQVKRGRPREASTDADILEAAAALLSQRGYRGMTVSAVAAAAGVSEPTVYLRHATKHDLAMAAVAQLPVLTSPPDTGDARADLIQLLSELVALSSEIGLSMVGVVIAEEPEHPELLEHWRTSVGSATLRAVSGILEAGKERGQIHPGVAIAAVSDLVLGAHIGHYLHEGEVDRSWATDVVDALWPALVAPGPEAWAS